MSDQIPDVSDPDVREMVLSHHRPDELWDTEAHPPQLAGVWCFTCRNQWPCPSIQAARKADGASTD